MPRTPTARSTSPAWTASSRATAPCTGSRVGWLQRLSYTIEPDRDLPLRGEERLETAYWSWYLRARVHTYKRRGKPVTALVGA